MIGLLVLALSVWGLVVVMYLMRRWGWIEWSLPWESRGDRQLQLERGTVAHVQQMEHEQLAPRSVEEWNHVDCPECDYERAVIEKLDEHYARSAIPRF